MAKQKMNQDELRDFFASRNLTVKRLGEMINQSDAAMSNALKHNIVNGKPLYFNEKKLQRINEALPVMADEIEARLMIFHAVYDEETQTVNRYDKSCVEQLRRVGEYFNIQGLTYRVLGWSKSKNNSVFSPASTSHGHVKASDVTAINTELLAVAGVLRCTEVVPMDN